MGLPQWVFSQAVAMAAMTAIGPSGLRKPRAMRRPPPSSLSPASAAHGRPGLRPIDSNQAPAPAPLDDGHCTRGARDLSPYKPPALHSGFGSAGSGVIPAPRTPWIAQYSSLSDVSPLMPTAPMAAPRASRIRTPPGTGTNSPPEAATTAVTKLGRLLRRWAMVREGMPMPSAPRALP